MSSSEDLNCNFIEHYPSCNYLQCSKSNNTLYLLRNYKGDKPSDEAEGISLDNLTDTSNEFFTSPVLGNVDSKSRKEGSQFLSASKALSPWLKFGLEKDPWKENEFQKMPKMVSPRKFNRGSLTGKIIISGISKLAQMPDTKSYAATKLQIANCKLTDVGLLGRFHCFQYIDMSWNEISDLSPLSNMNYLMHLNASHNKIKEVLNMKAPWYLTFVSLACNEITSIRDLSQFWSIRFINFSYNHITKIEGLQELKYLKHLNLSHNHITCLENLGSLNIEELNLEYNKIDCWEETESGSLNISPLLKYINLSHNCLKSLRLFEGLDNLKVLYVSHNLLSNIEELDFLKNMHFLQKISLEENEIAASNLYRHIIIYYLPQVNYIDGYKVVQAEKEANKVMFSQNISINRYNHHAKLLFYEQLANPPLGRDIKPCGSKCFPIIALVGPIGCKKLFLCSKLEAELSKYVYLGNCHLMSNTAHKSYEQFWKTNFIVDKGKFIDMVHDGEFLAVSEMIGGVMFGFSREQLSASIEKGKMCLVCVDLLMAFSLQALGLNPYLILTIVNDYDIHLKRLINVFSDREEVKMKIHSSFHKFRGSNHKTDEPNHLLEIEDFSDSTCSDHSSESVPNNISNEYLNIQKNYSQNSIIIGMKPNKWDQHWVDNITNSYVQENGNSKEADFSLLTKGSYGRLRSAGEVPIVIPKIIVKNLDSTVENDRTDNLMLSKKSASESYENTVTDEEKNAVDRKNLESNQNNEGSSERLDQQLSNAMTISNVTNEPSLLFLSTQRIQTPSDKILQQKYQSLSPSNLRSSSRVLDSSKNETRRKNSQMKLMRNDSTTYWSWGYSLDSVIDEEERFQPVESKRSSTIRSLRAINNIIEKVLGARPAYFELKESGYFAHTIFTDNEEEAFQTLRKIIKNKSMTEKNWKSHCSFEKNLLYKEAVLRKTTKFMEELDKTESTTCLSNT